MSTQGQHHHTTSLPAGVDIQSTLQLIASDRIFYMFALGATQVRRNEARRALITPTGTQYDNIRRGLFDSGNQLPIVPVLAVAKWMTREGNKHYDDVMLLFTNDLTPKGAQQMVFHTWDRSTDKGEPERNIVGYDCAVPPELDNDPMLLLQDIDPRFANIYEGYDASLFALCWASDEADIKHLQQGRWDISLITADSPDFWEFLAKGGIASRQVKAFFSPRWFSKRLYDWARRDSVTAMLWLDDLKLPSTLNEPTKKVAKRIVAWLRNICQAAIKNGAA